MRNARRVLSQYSWNSDLLHPLLLRLLLHRKHFLYDSMLGFWPERACLRLWLTLQLSSQLSSQLSLAPLRASGTNRGWLGPSASTWAWWYVPSIRYGARNVSAATGYVSSSRPATNDGPVPAAGLAANDGPIPASGSAPNDGSIPTARSTTDDDGPVSSTRATTTMIDEAILHPGFQTQSGLRLNHIFRSNEIFKI